MCDGFLFPVSATVDWFAIVLATLALIGLLRWKWDVIPVVLGAGVLRHCLAIAGAKIVTGKRVSLRAR
jgi:hypothetical protein